HPRAGCGHRRARGGHLGHPLPPRITRRLSAQRRDRSHPGHVAAEGRRVPPAGLRRPLPPRRRRIRARRCLPPGGGRAPRALHRLVPRTASPDAPAADSSSVTYPACPPGRPVRLFVPNRTHGPTEPPPDHVPARERPPEQPPSRLLTASDGS